jgi:hypothetical protein
MSLPFYTMYQILSSHYLKIDDEDQVLAFIYNYTNKFGMQYPDAVGYVTDLLAQTLRYSYLSIYKILSALRDNQHLRKSVVFLTHIS